MQTPTIFRSLLPTLFSKLSFTFSLALSLTIANSAFAANTDAEQWESLFNGKDLSGWAMKIAGHPLNENYKNTFHVENGVIKISYDEYERFENDFGHLFYTTPFSNYHLKLDYRFTGEQTPGAPEWAFRNAGVMFHSQSPESMRLDQWFPVCVELQILGGNGKDERTTGNMCSPGSHITLDGKLNKEHCIYTNSPTYHGDQWVSLELIVKDGHITHIINGKTVFEYSNPILDDSDADAKAMLDAGATLSMTSGYLALQAEGHNVEYRNIVLRKLPSGKSTSDKSNSAP